MNIPNYSPNNYNPNIQPNYIPNNQPQYPMPQAPPNYSNSYNSTYNGVGYQPMQPIQSYPQNNMIPSMPNSKAPLLLNQSNYPLEAIECMEDLNESPEAIITKNFEGLVFKDTKYIVTLKGTVNRNIFIGKKASKVFGNPKYFEVKVKYVPRDTDYNTFSQNKDFSKRLFDIYNLVDLSTRIGVSNKETGINFGNIKQPNICCCSDPDYQLINNQNYTRYRVTTDGCQCSYCCCDQCCCSYNETNFRILDSTRTQLVGEICKNEIADISKEKLTYRINFPRDASPEDKILLICTAISIDCLSYRRLGS